MTERRSRWSSVTPRAGGRLSRLLVRHCIRYQLRATALHRSQGSGDSIEIQGRIAEKSHAHRFRRLRHGCGEVAAACSGRGIHGFAASEKAMMFPTSRALFNMHVRSLARGLHVEGEGKRSEVKGGSPPLHRGVAKVRESSNLLQPESDQSRDP